MYEIILSKRAARDRHLLKQAGLETQARELLAVIKENPYRNPPPYEALKGNMKGLYSRRINYQHRLVYEVLEEKQIVHVLRMWTHYE
ncbi:MAG: Txe/YoeB family addiction module toxin [Anaerovoracaceae bacterium]